MKRVITLLVILLMGTVLANEFCLNQPLLGFENATFVLGADVLDRNIQDVAYALRKQLRKPLALIDSFVTPKTYYKLFRVTSTNELVLMTLREKHVCIYWVPTEEPIRQSHELS